MANRRQPQPSRRPRDLAPGELARAPAYKLVLEYEGTRYRGWQEQSNAKTVMGALRTALAEAGANVLDLGGAGRTDAGVHAVGQVAHLRLGSEVDPGVLGPAVNDALPADVNLLSVERADARFHARHAAESRSYVYQIARRRSALGHRFTWWLREELDLAAMGRAAALVAGEHDFGAFCQATPAATSTRVAVRAATLAEDGDLVLVRVEASHFLWKMVRRLTGALVRVGTARLTVEEFGALLRDGAARSAQVAEWTAPATGLFLERVRYAGDPELADLAALTPFPPAAPKRPVAWRPMDAHQPKKPAVPTGKDLDAQLEKLIRNEKILQAVMLYEKAHGVARGIATKAVNDIRRRIAAP
jgi:tRNA pseudouridine38-40 synthase